MTREITIQRFRNWLQSALLVALMAAILAAVGFLLAGIAGAVVAIISGLVIIAVGPRASPALVLRMYRARKLQPFESWRIHEVTRELSVKAGLELVPDLYYIPSRVMNAFSVGSPSRAAIALTDGILRSLNWRELTGVLAHEVSHIAHNDLKIMGLADTLSRFTHLLSHAGIFMLVLYLPFIILTGRTFSLTAILILTFAPTLSLFLQLALSRTREYDADLNAVKLTGDPAGLASALEKLEHYRMRVWDMVLLPGRRVPDPSLLRSHPHTAERINRLMSIAGTNPAASYPEHSEKALPEKLNRVEQSPGWKFGGIWR